MATSPFRSVLATLTALSLALAPVAALAEGNDAEAQRLADSRKAERFNVAIPGKELRAGAARIHVNAPMAGRNRRRAVGRGVWSGTSAGGSFGRDHRAPGSRAMVPDPMLRCSGLPYFFFFADFLAGLRATFGRSRL